MNMTLFAALPILGEVFFHNVYLFYDEPLLFSCKTNNGAFFFVEKLPDDDCERWLMTPISIELLKLLEANAVEIRSVFLDPSCRLSLIRHTENDEYSISAFDIDNLTDDLLPLPGEFLDYDPSNIIVNHLTNRLTLAETDKRDVIDIALEVNDSHEQEIECSKLTKTLTVFQDLMDSLVNNNQLLDHKHKKIKNRCEMKLSELFAASFGARLLSAENSGLFNNTIVSDALAELKIILNAGGSPKAFHDYLSTCQLQVLTPYLKFLQTLSEQNIGIKIASASPNGCQTSIHITTDNAKSRIAIAKKQLKDINEIVVIDGVLCGIDLRRKKFILHSITEEQYIKGGISESLYEERFIIPSKIRATLRCTYVTDNVNILKREYTLESVKET